MGATQGRAEARGQATEHPNGPVADDARVEGQTKGAAKGTRIAAEGAGTIATVVPDPGAREGVPAHPGAGEAAKARHTRGPDRGAARLPDPVHAQVEAGVAPRVEGATVA